MNTLIVGAGSMGTWIGRVLTEDLQQSVSVTYQDENPENARQAAGSVGGKYLASADTDCFDVVCIAVPIPETVNAISTHAASASEAILDVTGTMAEPVAAMAEHAPDCERLSLHPLFAPANEPGNIPMVVDNEGKIADSIRAALEARGNSVVETTPAEHDELMETVQAKTHAAILAFALAADDVPPEFHTPVSRSLFDLAQTVTDGQSRVYADIQASVDGATEMATAAEQLSNADRETFEQLYEQAFVKMQNTDED